MKVITSFHLNSNHKSHLISWEHSYHLIGLINLNETKFVITLKFIKTLIITVWNSGLSHGLEVIRISMLNGTSTLVATVGTTRMEPYHTIVVTATKLKIRCNQLMPGPRFNIKISSYQYRKSHCGDKTVVRSSYLHNGISYTGKMTSLYWIRALIFIGNIGYPSEIYLNTLRPRQNGRHFPDDTFKCIFLNENVWISIKISPKFVPGGPNNNFPALVQIMAWRRPGDKPSSELMMVSYMHHSASMS